jgi:hypothetical protein
VLGHLAEQDLERGIESLAAQMDIANGSDADGAAASRHGASIPLYPGQLAVMRATPQPPSPG